MQGGDDARSCDAARCATKKSSRSSWRKIPRCCRHASIGTSMRLRFARATGSTLARADLEATFELITESFAASGVLWMREKSCARCSRTWNRAVAEVATLNELFAVYRKAVGDIVGAAPGPGSRVAIGSLQRAVEYMQTRPERSPEARKPSRRAVAGSAPGAFLRGVSQERGRHFRALPDQAAGGTSPTAALAYGARQAPRPRSRGEAIRILERQLSMPHLQAKRGRDADGLSRTRSQGP